MTLCVFMLHTLKCAISHTRFTRNICNDGGILNCVVTLKIANKNKPRTVRDSYLNFLSRPRSVVLVEKSAVKLCDISIAKDTYCLSQNV